MHYIIGTRFSVIAPKVVPGRPQPSLRREKLLPSNLSYNLIHILKKDSEVDYRFLGSDNQAYTVTFNNCREADNFIAKHKNETIPDYEKINESLS
jgi:hypothetical protein